MKKLYTLILMTMCSLTMFGQGWPDNYPGVMLQGFYWIEEPANATKAQKDSIKAEFNSIKWTSMMAQADELSEFFSVIWAPPSGKASSNPSMGYDPTHWFTHSSTFGSAMELYNMIAAFKQRGTSIIADVVLNHRASTSGWLTFPNEKSGLDGKYYQIKSTDICANDDGGTTKAWADANGYKLSNTNDEGDDFSGMRDLDHTSSNVQTCVNAYLDYLIQTLGYSGFRLDMVKGYSSYYTGLYNYHAQPQFSVGEFWDSFDNIVNWMNGTRRDANGNYSSSGDVQSAAFDFPLKYKIKTACESGNWHNLYPYENDALAWNSYWPRWAVTFVDNHDSYREGHNRCNANQLAANAYILCMPGTPCVFMEHWKQYKQQIKQIIYARKLAGVTNQSSIEVGYDGNDCFSTKVNGGKIEILMGNGFGVYDASEGTDMTLVESGDNFAVYLSKSIDSPWVSLPTGSYEGPVSARFTALSNDTQTLVYTLDGTTPTANSTQLQSGEAIMLNESVTLKVGLLKNGSVVNVISRNYDITPGEEGQTVINVCTPIDEPYLYVWDVTGTSMNGPWPGTKMSDTFTSSNGTRWFTTTLEALGDINIIFNNGDGLQTRDITGVTQGTHYYYYDGVSGCDEVTADYKPAPPKTQITVNVTAPIAPYLYVWTDKGNELCGGWPGKQLSQTITQQGKTYYTRTLTTDDDLVNIIFNDGNGQQTANIEGLTTGTYYYVYDGESNYEEEFYTTPTGLTLTTSEGQKVKASIYDMQGRRVSTVVPLRKGVYVQNGKKIIVK